MRKTNFLTGQQIDQLALSHRRELGFHDDQQVDFMTLITKMKRKYPEFGYERVANSNWKHEGEAAWDSDKKTVFLPEDIFCAANRGESRAIMTVMHEVAHALRGHKGVLYRAPSGSNAEKFSTHVKRLEWEARRYAAAFLIPAIEWIQNASIIEIVAQYNVSYLAASIRKAELK